MQYHAEEMVGEEGNRHQAALEWLFEETLAQNEPDVHIRARELDERAGGDAGSPQRLALATRVLYQNIREGDEITRQPAEGPADGSLEVRFVLPRRDPGAGDVKQTRPW